MDLLKLSVTANAFVSQHSLKICQAKIKVL